MKKLADQIRDRGGPLLDDISNSDLAEIARRLERVRGGREGDAIEQGILLAHEFSELQNAKKSLERDLARARRARKARLPRRLKVDTLVTTEVILKLIDRDVRELRRQHFESSAPPFSDAETAAAWLAGDAQEGRPLEGQELVRYLDLHSQVYRAVGDLEEIADVPVGFEWSSSELRYYKPKDGGGYEIGTAGGPLGSPIAALVTPVRELARRTKLLEEDVLGLVLYGRKPTLTRISVEDPSEEGDLISEVTITFRSSEISWLDMEVAYAEIRRSRGTRANLVNEKDKTLFEAVQKMGGPPKRETRSKKEYWERVRRSLEREGVNYKDWTGPMMRWRRLREKNPLLMELVEA